jgi:hypothetical protein
VYIKTQNDINKIKYCILYMIIFNKLFGRLGNNIMQLSNIIDIAIAYKHNIKFNVKIKFFDLSIIEQYFNKYNNSQIITDEKHYFFYKNILQFPLDIYKQNCEERNKILQKAFLIEDINKIPENNLVIHIRSGDIFSSNPHPNYIPPPLSYYIKEIDKCKYEKIYIVCEDNINPVVNKLLGLYKNAVYTKNTLEKDIQIILGATNIIYSVGVFVPALLLLSNNKKYVLNVYSNNETNEYFKTMRPWKNTKSQRDYILNYKYN